MCSSDLEPLKAKLAGDIFIPPPAVGSAMHGDRVLVEIGNIRPDGRAEGRIMRLIGRAHSTVVGKFHYGTRSNYVTPIDQKITQEIVIQPGLEYPEDGDVNDVDVGASVHARAEGGMAENAEGPLHDSGTLVPARHERGRSRPHQILSYWPPRWCFPLAVRTCTTNPASSPWR